MKRIIKFRAWEKPFAETGFEGKMHYDIIEYLNKWLYSDDYEIMQFTGIVDRTGKDVYDGDVLGGYPHGEVVVKWDDKFACFSCYDPETKQDYGLFGNCFDDCKQEVEVIGNIYETPYLIK